MAGVKIQPWPAKRYLFFTINHQNKLLKVGIFAARSVLLQIQCGVENEKMPEMPRHGYIHNIYCELHGAEHCFP